MLGDDQRTLHAQRAIFNRAGLESTCDQSPVSLFDAMLAEARPQARPNLRRGGHQLDTRGFDIQAMNDPAAQAPLAHALNLGPSLHQVTQHRLGLVGPKRVNGPARRLIDGEPTRPLSEQHGGDVLRRRDPLVARGLKGIDLDLTLSGQTQALVTQREPYPI